MVLRSVRLVEAEVGIAAFSAVVGNVDDRRGVVCAQSQYLPGPEAAQSLRSLQNRQRAQEAKSIEILVIFHACELGGMLQEVHQLVTRCGRDLFPATP